MVCLPLDLLTVMQVQTHTKRTDLLSLLLDHWNNLWQLQIHLSIKLLIFKLAWYVSVLKLIPRAHISCVQFWLDNFLYQILQATINYICPFYYISNLFCSFVHINVFPLRKLVVQERSFSIKIFLSNMEKFLQQRHDFLCDTKFLSPPGLLSCLCHPSESSQ
jgi:hypothetical protein